jgi:two-component system, OmpR family, sensor kinase
MNRLQQTRLRLPVRLKLAVVSAGLTFVILLLFAVVVGAFTERRLHTSFDTDLRSAAVSLQDRVRAKQQVPRDVLQAAAAGGAALRVVDRDGAVLGQFPANAPDFGAPADGLRDAAGYRVSSIPLFESPLDTRDRPFAPLGRPVDGAVAFLQYGRPQAGLHRTVAKVRLFLGVGVLGGTVLAFLAGLAVARRAMRPITRLTSAAREVARTRDPVVTLPKPEASDEVSELAHTLEDMLRELGAARSETEAALSRQREFVADASHELRTPLTSILANLELLESELGGDNAEIAASALRSSRRMRRLVADLLPLARADAGREAPRRPVDLAAVAMEAVLEASPLAGEGQVAVDAPQPVPVTGTADDLHRMALNLIENALLHTPQGTPVTVAARREGNTAVLEVSDRGQGIPSDLRERVFERFARGAGSGDVTPTRSGSGLGLAIVLAVAEGHGGSVELAEAPGGGARFIVRLPAGSPQAPVPSPQELPASPPRSLRAD